MGRESSTLSTPTEIYKNILINKKLFIMRKFIMLVILCVMSLLGINAQKTTNQTRKNHYTATYYGDRYKTARKTASGEAFNMHAMTCAAPKHFSFGTKLRVTNLANNKSVIVKVTDRGYLGNNTIDLTYGAFGKIASHRTGRIKINVEVIS